MLLISFVSFWWKSVAVNECAKYMLTFKARCAVMFLTCAFKSVVCHQFIMPPVTHSPWGYTLPCSQLIGFFLWKMFHRIVLLQQASDAAYKKKQRWAKKQTHYPPWWRWHLKTASDSNVEQVNFCVWKDLWEDNTRPICTQSKRVFPFEFAPDSSRLAEVPELNNERRRIRGLSLFCCTKSPSEL